MKVPVRRLLKAIVLALAWILGVFAVMQLVPYGRTHSNPPIVKEPAWDSPRTRELAARACFDCHSNRTRWPWYADVAPFSWVVQRDVETARSVVNFSEWNVPTISRDYSGTSVILGNMPPVKYRMAHPEADSDPSGAARARARSRRDAKKGALSRRPGHVACTRTGHESRTRAPVRSAGRDQPGRHGDSSARRAPGARTRARSGRRAVGRLESAAATASYRSRCR